jgi:hypothetical protein
MMQSEEYKRLNSDRNWKKWGPYLAERAWGTVREDYSNDGNAWNYFSHDAARSRVYRWNEDGLAGICDDNQYLCLALSLWNHHDPILKERMFGLTNGEGNHGEDVKEYFFYLDNTPTHSYMKLLYKYPHFAYPYEKIVRENASRGYYDFEYELLDTGIFNDNNYFDVVVEYAKADVDDIMVRVSVTNRGDKEAACSILPNLWFRNTWKWGYEKGPRGDVDGKPSMQLSRQTEEFSEITLQHPGLGEYYFYSECCADTLFAENETNNRRLFNSENDSPYVKDAFHEYIVNKNHSSVNPEKRGTKAASLYDFSIPAGETKTIKLRLTPKLQDSPFAVFDQVFADRIREADEYYNEIQPKDMSSDKRNIQRQGFAGMLWSKQLYYYNVEQWLSGDPGQIPPPKERERMRNSTWKNVDAVDIISMPDKWEYPWFATWDWAFHCWPLSLIDPVFAKDQLRLIISDQYTKHDQIPAYEWNFDDLNPPVLVWAAWRIYKIEGKQFNTKDIAFLDEIFQKLELNFSWWYDYEGVDHNGLFQGGFMGLDNINIFDRSKLEIEGAHLDQADTTAWMGLYSLTMMQMALELAADNNEYESKAITYLEHFFEIIQAMNNRGGDGKGLWDEEDGIFYDTLHYDNGYMEKLKVRSLVGLMPLLAVEVIEEEILDRFPKIRQRLEELIEENAIVLPKMANPKLILTSGGKQHRLLAALNKERLTSLVNYISDESEFLSTYGIRSVSKYHNDHPYDYGDGNPDHILHYLPAESNSGLFGGNSNWRGPIWFPINFLIIEALQKFGYYYGDQLKIEFPKGSGNHLKLDEIAGELSRRLIKIFEKDSEGKRPVYGGIAQFQTDPHWQDHILFYEYFHGDNGAGLGASHQTGWTGLVLKLIQQNVN